MPLDTDFNVSPYFDDYDEAKRYYRILFRPSVSVQARELSQSQTIQQKQIERFGDHMFYSGSVVEGCNPTVLQNLDFIRVADAFTLDNTALISSINSNNLLLGATSNVRAVVVVSKEGLVASYPDTNRFYVKYLNSGVNGEKTFANGELINVYGAEQSKLGNITATVNNTIYVISTNTSVNAAGKGVGFRVEDGIIYHKGFFQIIPDQTIVARDYDQNTGNTVIGFETIEEIITENVDESLLDNALGYSNENAPGAHRLKLTPTPVAKERTEIANNDTFFAAFEFSNISNELIINRNKTPYKIAGDIASERTYDESGDYVTKPFAIESLETGNSSTFAYQVSPGKGYVHGSQIEYLAARKVETDRAITTLEGSAQGITTNYGNFVYVNQYAGALNFGNSVQVDIYNSYQNRITNKLTGAVTGTKVGTAKVKSVLHYEGNPGEPTTSYKVYLTDIVMNSGKSFFNDAKSIYANTAVNSPFGEGFADITSNLQQSGKSSLVFPFNKKALKTLRSGNGAINDTMFDFRNSTAGTLKVDGNIDITATSSYTGGADNLGYSTGTLGDGIEDDFITVLTANVSTANITGTVSVSSATNVISTAGLNSYFANGEFIKVYTGLAVEYARVVSVDAAQMIVDAPFTASNTACNFGKHYPAGYVIPLKNSYPGTRYIDVTSSTTFTVHTGAAAAASLETTAPVVVQYRMTRSQANQAKKDINKGRYVVVHANNSSNNSWNLGLPDVLRINKVYANATSSSNATTDDYTKYFTLDNGQRDDYYDHARLVLKPQYAGSFTANHIFTVELDHFTANLNNGIGFFSVDSYPVTNSVPTSTQINWIEIPQYNSGSANYDLRDCVDFRPFKVNTAVSTTTLASATVNPTTTTSFITDSFRYVPEPDTNFIADIEYYLGRIDLVTMNSTGGLNVIKGTPSESPRQPTNDTDSMVLATANVPPFPTLTTRVAEQYNRADYAVRTKRTTNRGYTMRDIGVLDQRIERLEYYTTLNALEQKAQNLQVPDANGLNRFKNGIFADPMTSHAFAATTDIEYRWCIDSGLGFGRPLYSSENVDLAYANSLSSNVQQTGKYVTLPYTHEVFIYQPFATKYRNNTQDLWAWKGSVDLFPTYDMNRDETLLPNIDTTLDLTQPFMDFANIVSQATGSTIFGTRWGDWRTTSAMSTSSQSLVWRFLVTNTQTTLQQARSGTNTFMVPISNLIDLGRYVTDVSVQPYMKSRTVAFVARNLKPNTRIYAYFDDVSVTDYCAPGALNTALGADINEVSAAAAASGKPDDVCVRTGAFGDPMISDQYGTLYGMFQIPDGQFRTGDRQFQLLDSDSLITGADAALTRAVTMFTASNISVTSRNATITTVTPSFQQASLTDTRTVINNSQSIRMIEPIAQSFTVEAPEQQSGVFITKIDLFFKSKDPNLGIKVVVIGMNTGVPDSSVVYGTARVDSSSVNVSDTAATETTFVFDNPIFLSANKEYAFYIEPEGGSPEYKMWMSELGFFDVITNAQVYKNPYGGDAFRSSNAKTWTAMPKEDVKFNLYVANFSVGTGTAFFENENDEYITYDTLTVFDSLKNVAVGDHVYLVNSSTNTAVYDSGAVNGIVQFIDTTNAKIKIDSSAGGFTAGQKIGFFRLPQQANVSQANTTTRIASANVHSVDNPILHSIVPRFATLLPAGTSIDTSFEGTLSSSASTKDTAYNELTIDLEREMLDIERAVFSKSNETSGKTLTVKTVFNNSNKYLSPVIDLSRKSALVIKNIINNDATDEHTRYGKAIAKYISQPISLAEGQDAEDIKVYVTAYRPINTDVEIYIKFLNGGDSSTVESKVWSKLVNQSEGLRSSSIDPYDFREYVYSMPTSINYDFYERTLTNNTQIGYTSWVNPSSTPFAGIIQYTDSSGVIYQSYKTFIVKIVLRSTSGIYVPKINDIRSISLQV